MKENRSYADVVIAGGGASGLAAAIEIRMTEPSLSVTVIEKNSETGRKIRATGSGRCNITNRDADGYNEIMEFFTRIGIVTRTYENGLAYPYSESAADVADLLALRAEELGVRIITDAEVASAAGPAESPLGESDKKSTPRFETSYRIKTPAGTKDRTISSDYLVLSCGGKAGPMFGTTGDGYRLAREFGHSIVTPVPVLTPVECEEWTAGYHPAGITLAGTRTRGTVTLYRGEADTGCSEALFEETGEIQFTKYGLSGICIFNMTRHMRYDRKLGESIRDFTISADLFPDGSIEDFLRERQKNAFFGEKAADILRTVLKENIASYVIDTAGSAAGTEDLGSKTVQDLTEEEICAISRAVHALEFHPSGLRGWKDAQATSGGVSMEELDPYTSGSRLISGLYITGELADRDYMCGGFNLSNAWITGLHAAHAICAGAGR